MLAYMDLPTFETTGTYEGIWLPIVLDDDPETLIHLSLIMGNLPARMRICAIN